MNKKNANTTTTHLCNQKGLQSPGFWYQDDADDEEDDDDNDDDDDDDADDVVDDEEEEEFVCMIFYVLGDSTCASQRSIVFAI